MSLDNAVRLVPKDPDPFDEIVAMVDRLGWTQTGDSGDSPEWAVPDSKTAVRWVQDGDTGVHFFVVEGDDRAAVADLIGDNIDLLQVSDFESYLGRFHSPQGLIRGLYTVAAAAPTDPDRRVTALFQRYLDDDDPLIRRAAIIATGIPAWADFVTPVTRLRDNDPDPAVRDAATAALRSLPS